MRFGFSRSRRIRASLRRALEAARRQEVRRSWRRRPVGPRCLAQAQSELGLTAIHVPRAMADRASAMGELGIVLEERAARWFARRSSRPQCSPPAHPERRQ